MRTVALNRWGVRSCKVLNHFRYIHRNLHTSTSTSIAYTKTNTNTNTNTYLHYSTMSSENLASKPITSLYDASIHDAKGKEYDVNALKGKIVLVVNVASKCGFTPQYDGLEELYKKYKDRNFEIIGFPCNQFMGQAPGSADEQANYCRLNHGVTFPILEKVDVNGSDAHPLYEWMKSQKSGFLCLKRVWWNFEKFLIDEKGQVINRFGSNSAPKSFEKDIEQALDNRDKNSSEPTSSL